MQNSYKCNIITINVVMLRCKEEPLGHRDEKRCCFICSICVVPVHIVCDSVGRRATEPSPMAVLERNNKILLDLTRQPWNSTCADCGAPEPDWASYTLGVFLCVNCSGMHRNLPSISKVKSIHLDHWQDSLVEAMRQRGNSVAKATYEKCVPAFIYRPQPRDCLVLKDQWIRAKYERREFTGEKGYFQQSYGADTIEATLWKKGKDNKQFLKRIFLLSHKDFTLRYFTKEDSRVPKAVIGMKELNAVFQPEKLGHAHGLQISYLQDVRTRNIFVYHENGQVIVSFFNAIRATRLAYLQKKHPTLRQSEQREPFRKRWFTLCLMNRKLLYYKSPLDATELGAVFIGTQSHGYSVSEGGRRSGRGGRWHRAVTLQTPQRQFVFMCEQEQEQQEWLEAFGKVIGQPMTAEDYANEANLRRRK
ncbi:arf-GAP with dual PH domain-containing protein 2-like isoform X3 [Phyllopteryx taeniolatus]|uniref:arf-GAP with dual PH domain-containing protein 2-like isoform X3 n=1 Tax=Phyllopteryx taeniolatus TaxID=161469 RepID=UPI002AD3A340|nr:arf-GAP with dual PH domain-containing protein 2-like isoform X3 [Phyllopteryx taeniolatus]